MESPRESDVRSAVREELRLLGTLPDDATVDDDTMLGDGGLHMESLYVIQLLMRLERRYQLTLVEETGELTGFTVGELVRRITAASPEDDGAPVVSRDDIRSILVDSAASGVPADVGHDSPLLIDSFTLVWLKHELEERHDVVIDPGTEDLDRFTSIDGIHDYLVSVAPDRVAAPGTPR